MTTPNKLGRVETKGPVLRGPLMYLNYPKKYRRLAHDHLLNGQKIDKYYPEFSPEVMSRLGSYKEPVRALLAEAAGHDDTRSARKIREAALVKAYYEMYEKNEAHDFQEAVKAVWGSPNTELFYSLLYSAIEHADNYGRSPTALQEIKRLINTKHVLKEPSPGYSDISPQLFRDAKAVFRKSYQQEIRLLNQYVSHKPFVHRYNPDEICHLLDRLLTFYGLDKSGWKTQINGRTERVMVSYDSKLINVAPTSFRLSRPRAVGLILHEVMVHALSKSKLIKNARVLGERRIIEEGLGIFVEQMMFRRFQPVRSLRYIALGLALGLDGKTRNAREVYEIIWRLRYLGGVAHNKKAAQEYAAKEVVRVFRGMPLTQRGVVITKDKAYVEGNLLIWAHVKDHGAGFIFDKLLSNSL